MVSKEIENLQPLINHFNTIGKCSSVTFKFWQEYCDMVELLLSFLASERDSNWQLHLETFQEMLAYNHAFNHYKYFLWGTKLNPNFRKKTSKMEIRKHFLFENFTNFSFSSLYLPLEAKK